MSDQYLSEIRIMSFPFAPKGWAQANGQTMPIAQNQALFALLGTTYGGNGTTTFMLPNLQGRLPIHFSSGYPLGAVGGEEMHTLALGEIPMHHHGTMTGTSTSTNTVATPTGNVLAATTSNVYVAGVPSPVVLPAASVTIVGSNQPHENRQPYLALNFCIALTGIFPSRN